MVCNSSISQVDRYFCLLEMLYAFIKLGTFFVIKFFTNQQCSRAQTIWTNFSIKSETRNVSFVDCIQSVSLAGGSFHGETTNKGMQRCKQGNSQWNFGNDESLQQSPSTSSPLPLPQCFPHSFWTNHRDTFFFSLPPSFSLKNELSYVLMKILHSNIWCS